MPGDSRRCEGPASMEYRKFIKRSTKEDFWDKYTRLNNGSIAESRGIAMRVGFIKKAKGSALVELGKTKVICSVFDPREIPNKTAYCVNGRLCCDFKFAPFSSNERRPYGRSADEKEYSLKLRSALNPAVIRHEFPNLQIDICVMVIENDGSAFSVAVTCASLALANAGFAMYDLVTSVSMGLYNSNEIIDPTLEEEMECNRASGGAYLERNIKQINSGTITVSYMPSLQQITYISCNGLIEQTKMEKYIERLIEENRKIHAISGHCLARKVILSLNNKEKYKSDK